MNTSRNMRIIQRLNLGLTLRHFKTDDGTIDEVTLFDTLYDPLSGDACGGVGKAAELSIRSLLGNRFVDRINLTGRYDGESALLGRWLGLGRSAVYEVKTACGELPLRPTDCVLYCPLVDPDIPCSEQFYIFTWDEWQEMLNGYTGRGSLIRMDSARGKAHIQSFYGSETVRPKASKPIADYLWTACNSHPVLADILEEYR